MARKYSSNHSGKGFTFAMVAIIVVVFALGVYAVYGTVADGIKEKRAAAMQEKLASGAATIEERADSMGMEVDEFLKTYGLTDSGLAGSDAEANMYDKMTIGNFAKYNGTAFTEDTFNEFKAAAGLGDDVTMDSKDSNVKSAYVTYLQQQQAEQATESADADVDTEQDAEADTQSDTEADTETEQADTADAGSDE